MSIKYLPKELLKKLAPQKKIEKLVKGDLTLNRAVLSFLSEADFLSKPTLEKTALKTIKEYKAAFQENKDEGIPAPEAKEEALNDKKQLIHRVQNVIILQVTDEIRNQYWGEYYRWLPSSAENPDPLHQLKYGKKFQIGKGEMPGDRFGCMCGMEILVNETKLDL